MEKNSESNSQKLLFESIEKTRLDPAFVEFLNEVKEAQDAIDELSKDDLDSITIVLTALNRRWEELDWTQKQVTISGKIRLLPDHETEDACLKDLTHANKSRHDEKGLYYEIASELLVCADFTLNIDPDFEQGAFAEVPKIVIGFSTVSHYDNMLADASDEDVAVDGCLGMYPDEIEAIAFDEPSVEAIEVYLMYHHPVLFEELSASLPKGIVGNKRLKDFLNSFEIILNDQQLKDTRLKRYIERYLEAQLGFGRDMYEITTEHSVETIDDTGRPVVSMPLGDVLRIYGNILRLHLEDDITANADHAYVLKLITAVPERDANGAYSILSFNAKEIRSIRNLQNVQRYFGARATYLFDSMDDAESFLNGYFDAGTRTFSQQEIESQKDTEVREKLMAYSSSMESIGRIVGVDEGSDVYYLNIADDTLSIASRFRESCELAGVNHHDGPLIEANYNRIVELMFAEEMNLAELRRQDTLRVVGPFIGATFDTKNKDTQTFLTKGDDAITGTFSDVFILKLADSINALTRGAAGGYEYQATIALSNVQVVDASGMKREMSTLFVPITSKAAPDIQKVVSTNYFEEK
jgi:hypothetical protein